MPASAQPDGDAISTSSSRASSVRASDAGGASSGTPGSPTGLLLRNAPLVVLGEAVPAVAAVVAMPLLVASLGVDRLGVLTLAWVVIGYFGMFDLGIGRATTQLVSARLAAGAHADVPGVVRTSMVLLLALGCAGGAVLAALAPWLVGGALRLPEELARESLGALRVLALTVPLVVLSSGLRGVLEARRRFAALAALRAALGVISFLGPLLVIPFSRSVLAVVVVLAAGRVVLLAVSALLCRDVLRAPTVPGARLDRAVAHELVRFGGWLTVSNALSPLLVLLDRFVVGAVVSVGAVAFYATPLELVQRAGVVPIAIGTVLFPAMAASALTDPAHARALFTSAVRLCLLGVFPILVVLVLWSHEGLELWLGAEFARESTSVVRWIAPGLLVNAVGAAAIVALQASGRPDLPAKFHVLELLGYAPLLWILASRYGVEGAAIAWSVRVAVDALLLMLAALQIFPLAPRTVLRLLAAVGGGLATLAVASIVVSTGAKIGVTGLVIAAAAVLAVRLVPAARRAAHEAAR